MGSTISRCEKNNKTYLGVEWLIHAYLGGGGVLSSILKYHWKALRKSIVLRIIIISLPFFEAESIKIIFFIVYKI